MKQKLCVFFECTPNISRPFKSPLGQGIKKVKQISSWDKKLKENQKKPMKIKKVLQAVVGSRGDCFESNAQGLLLTATNQRNNLKTPNCCKSKQNLSKTNIRATSTLKGNKVASTKNLFNVCNERSSKIHIKCNNWFRPNKRNGNEAENDIIKGVNNVQKDTEIKQTEEDAKVPQSTKGDFKFTFKEDALNKRKLAKTATHNFITKAIREANAELNIPQEFPDEQSQFPCLSGTFAISLDHLLIGKQIGQGAYASVSVAFDRHLGHRVALKIYNKAKLKETQRMKNIQSEIKIMQRLKHPNVVKFYSAFDTRNHTIIEMENVKGPSLHGLLKSKEGQKLSESEARRVLRQVVDGIAYCHGRGIAHRDVKLENVLLDEKWNVRIIDFGFSTCMPRDKKLRVFCGTPSYMAPEIVLRKEHAGPPADMWAIGVLAYILLCGRFPFTGSTDKELYNNIAHGRLHLPHHLSPASKSLIARMLAVEPERRVTAEEVGIDEWLLDVGGLEVGVKEVCASVVNADAVEAYRGASREKDKGCYADLIRPKLFSNTLAGPFSNKNLQKYSFAAKLNATPLEPRGNRENLEAIDLELVSSIVKLGYPAEEVQRELQSSKSYIRSLYDRLVKQKNGNELCRLGACCEQGMPKDALGGVMKFNGTAPFQRLVKPSATPSSSNRPFFRPVFE
eukprot:TRINITY_DN12971_c0_g6_i3.p1 TRINITY_DN12971_c0_g6~~TRINITY_DN12971_c0_g6_i3.p1  ORF type:complete len:678 (+),score=133.18 TRINITY_DN12971_c0_g6_i3:175-2208(+)